MPSVDSWFDIDLHDISTLDELEDKLDKDLADAIESLNAQWKSLSAEIDTYEESCTNTEKVSDFFETIL